MPHPFSKYVDVVAESKQDKVKISNIVEKILFDTYNILAVLFAYNTNTELQTYRNKFIGSLSIKLSYFKYSMFFWAARCSKGTPVSSLDNDFSLESFSIWGA